MVKLEIDDSQTDVLRELSNIGSGKALMDLERYVKVGIREGLPFLDIMSIKDIPGFLGSSESRIVSVYAPVSGDIDGTVVTLFPFDSALILVDLVYDRTIHSTKKLSSDEEVLIKKVGESLFNSYLEAIIEFLDINVSHEKSVMLKGSRSDIIKESEFLSSNEVALVLETSFGIPTYEFEGGFILIIDTKSMDVLLNAVQKKFGF